MPTFLLISRDAPESCWLFNERARQVRLNQVDTLESILRKHTIPALGAWVVPHEHTLYQVFDVPVCDAIQKMAMELEFVQWSAFNTTEIKKKGRVPERRDGSVATTRKPDIGLRFGRSIVRRTHRSEKGSIIFRRERGHHGASHHAFPGYRTPV